MKTWMVVTGLIVGLILLTVITVVSSGIGIYNSLQTKEEQVNNAWAEVVNQYQRRSDLTVSLVSVVQGYAKHEKSTLVGIAQARASATSITMTPAMLNNAAEMAKFQAAQGAISGFLSKLMVASENYPELKADKQFVALQTQIEGTENRITVARNRYIKTVTDWNLQVRSFPSNLIAGMFGYTTKVQFTVEDQKKIDHAPEIKFE